MTAHCDFFSVHVYVHEEMKLREICSILIFYLHYFFKFILALEYKDAFRQVMWDAFLKYALKCHMHY